MSKVVLVFDKPENCEDCPCVYTNEYGHIVTCQADNGIYEIPDYGVHPSCPLKPLPEKIGVPEDAGSYQLGYANGWNALVNKLSED